MVDDVKWSLLEQYCQGSYDITARGDIRDADSVRLWDNDTCVAEWTRHLNGWLVVTGSDVNAFDIKSLRGHRDLRSALDAGVEWYRSL